ncbi:hypothetical protein HBDW_18950 [Herbaspirillum sp. DW155]|uniref:hypothetical protein n=1 Tax=Herbaspirillum sp. DW155 TaxID=3095609 RepID=UPI0030916B6D|nr:hypothetical protein HBDW_18950 [Herbaspirillum sp. DW155]
MLRCNPSQSRRYAVQLVQLHIQQQRAVYVVWHSGLDLIAIRGTGSHVAPEIFMEGKMKSIKSLSQYRLSRRTSFKQIAGIKLPQTASAKALGILGAWHHINILKRNAHTTCFCVLDQNLGGFDGHAMRIVFILGNIALRAAKDLGQCALSKAKLLADLFASVHSQNSRTSNSHSQQNFLSRSSKAIRCSIYN